MRESRLRFSLFAVWATLFMAYVLMFLFVGRFKTGVGVDEARAAAWRAAYTLLPVLSAFGAFWFALDRRDHGQGNSDTIVDWDRVLAAYVLTAMVHGVVLTYFLLYVVAPGFSLSPDEPGESFVAAVDWGMNVLGVLSAVVLLPVSYILKQPDLKKLDTRLDGATADASRKEAG